MRRLDGGEELYYNQAMVEPLIQCLIQQVPAHSDRFLIEMFQNHGLKEWISLKIMLLWLWKVIMSLFNHEK